MSGPQDQRPPRRRALPTVSDVVRELRGSTSAEPELLFKAARQVCAEELNRAKQGFEPAPMEILVKRARRLLGVAEELSPTLRMENAEALAESGAPVPPADHPPMAVVFETESEPAPSPALAPRPALPAPAPTPRFVLSAAEEPFLETTGSIDLKGVWARKVSLLDDPLSPLGEASPAPPPVSAPHEGPTMALPLGGIDLLSPPAGQMPSGLEPFVLEDAPLPSRIETPEPEPLALEAEIPAPVVSEPVLPLSPSPSSTPPPEHATVQFVDGPGEETLDQLKVAAAAVRFEEVLPALESTAASPAPPQPPLPVPSESTPVPKAVAPPAVEPVTPEPPPETKVPEAKVPEAKAPGAVRWKDVEPEASSLFSPAPAGPVRSRAPLVVAVLIGAAAVAAWYYLKPGGAAPSAVAPTAAPAAVPTAVPTEAVAAPTVSTPPAATEPTAVPVLPAPAPPEATAVPIVAPTTAPPTPTAPTVRKAEAAPSPSVVRTPGGPAAAAQSRASTVTTPDWAGKEPVFAVHFSSYRDRATADKDAARLGKSLERPGRAIAVDLGEKGVWYRVMIGEFGTVEEALAYRAELEQKSTPNMGFVYRIVGKAP